MIFQDDSDVIGSELANGYFGSLVPESPFLWRAMEYFLHFYDNAKWSTGGAGPLTRALYDACGIDKPPRLLTSKGPSNDNVTFAHH